MNLQDKLKKQELEKQDAIAKRKAENLKAVEKTIGILKENSNPQPKKCSICKDVGFVFVDGTARLCECQLRKIESERKSKTRIPLIEARVGNFKTQCYSNEQLALKAKTICKNYVLKIKDVKGKGLYFYSKTKGSGKTHLACAIGNAICTCKKVRFYTTIDLLNRLKLSFKEGNTQMLIDTFKSVDVLILDDIGAEKPSEWVSSTLFDILNYRMEQEKITIFTSNCKQSELKFDDRITSRIISMSIEVKMPEQDVRNGMNQSKNDVEKMLGF